MKTYECLERIRRNYLAGLISEEEAVEGIRVHVKVTDLGARDLLLNPAYRTRLEEGES